MSTTLKEILKAVESFRDYYSNTIKTKKENLVEKYLGRFKGIIPKGKTSTQYIRQLRSSLYGKIK